MEGLILGMQSLETEESNVNAMEETRFSTVSIGACGNWSVVSIYAC